MIRLMNGAERKVIRGDVLAFVFGVTCAPGGSRFGFTLIPPYLYQNLGNFWDFSPPQAKNFWDFFSAFDDPHVWV